MGLVEPERGQAARAVESSGRTLDFALHADPAQGLRDRLVRLFGAREMHTTVQAIEDAASRVSRFLLMQTIINTLWGAGHGQR
jgi:hypothetical protein